MLDHPSPSPLYVDDDFLNEVDMSTNGSALADADNSEAQGQDLDAHALAIITFISNRMAAGAAGPLRKHFGLSVTEARIAFLVGGGELTSSNAIAQHIGLDKAAISRGVNSLVQMGLLTQERDPRHASRLRLSLTEEGLKRREGLRRFNFRREAHLLSSLSAREQKQLVQSLRKVLENVEAANKLSQLGVFF
ncbi:MarR family winged helix-turn-helix transcriptional regulator [Sphingosinicella rhizophila]|uniref:MarR family winged helix-turn-helix transcriptional regulator n=1 Tax=Sphingosinicella rhizophila TaxID=3050082 RepID=A0ABU3Q1T8_9SPHN|nr:MarR family winged helix-turn-helix transcriptional regulator [Sphingosinicella sp. GR2756]MDT9597380.1 MarR family winged helix-turn-helix transcriptional regulator [Sphingosinicella sp. GR2756]